ncbi:MAG: bifunctional folylpolyglutamate synthase/dihydrofolate synthase, partial [Planctomycetota bacterium]
MRKLLEVLGDPHEQIKAIHVAGTKGKGSTCGMTASMLTAAGYTTGLYSSPHLSDLRERITIDGQMVSYPATIDLFQQIAKAEVKTGLSLTFFEIMTAAALLYFAEQCVDVAVLETGLGG